MGLILDYHHPTIKLPKHYWAANIEQDDNMVITRTHVTILLLYTGIYSFRSRLAFHSLQYYPNRTPTKMPASNLMGGQMVTDLADICRDNPCIGI